MMDLVDDEKCIFQIIKNVDDPETFKFLLENGARKYITCKDDTTTYFYCYKSFTPLMVCCYHCDNIAILKLLLDYGADETIACTATRAYCHEYDRDKQLNALMVAILSKRSCDYIQLLLDYGAKKYLDHQAWDEGSEYHTALMYAFRENQLDVMKLLLEYGAMSNMHLMYLPSVDKMTMAYFTIPRSGCYGRDEEKHMRAINLLSKYRGFIRAFEECMESEVRWLVECSYEYAKFILIKLPTRIIEQTMFPFACAKISNMDPKIIHMFLDRYVNVKVKGYGHETPLISIIANISYSYLPILKRMVDLIGNDYDYFNRGSDTYTALMYACRFKNSKLVMKMLKILPVNKHTLAVKNKKKENALLIAMKAKQSVEVLSYLYSNGGHAFIKDKDFQKASKSAVVRESLTKMKQYIATNEARTLFIVEKMLHKSLHMQGKQPPMSIPTDIAIKIASLAARMTEDEETAYYRKVYMSIKAK